MLHTNEFGSSGSEQLAAQRTEPADGSVTANIHGQRVWPEVLNVTTDPTTCWL